MEHLTEHWEELRGCIMHAAEQLSSIHTAQQQKLADLRGLKSMAPQLLLSLRSAMYPQIFDSSSGDALLQMRISSHLQQSAILLREMLCMAMDEQAPIDATVCAFLQSLPDITRTLATDIRAAYEGDPAARSEAEIMLAYPAFEAISIYRLAHRLYELEVPLIPRMMTEHAHQTTGIDIHPGATIGPYFFIDHGTGVVIGETCTIGDHVKLYQGVTLGAKSFETDDGGNPIKGMKRHPDIGNHVVIYAGATILGGNTVIGDGCVVGGNVWLTRSIRSGSTVYRSYGET